MLMHFIRKGLVVCALALLSAAVRAERTPNLSLKDLDGHAEKLASLRGQIVVLNFWATWCGPCQEELPRLSRMAQQFAGEKVHFVAVSIDEGKDRGKIEPLLQKLDVHLDVWAGASSDTLDRFGLGNIVPGTIILDDHGEVVSRIEGEAREEDVRAPVEWLLHGRPGAVPAAHVKRY
jgi:thiol-disulfide isomerase/thioredoxin